MQIVVVVRLELDLGGNVFEPGAGWSGLYFAYRPQSPPSDTIPHRVRSAWRAGVMLFDYPIRMDY